LDLIEASIPSANTEAWVASIVTDRKNAHGVALYSKQEGVGEILEVGSSQASGALVKLSRRPLGPLHEGQEFFEKRISQLRATHVVVVAKDH
jgi:hypothetical protein